MNSLRELNQKEVSLVSGAGDIIDVYPPIPAGYEIIGYSMEVVGWSVTSMWEHKLFSSVEHIESIPQYEINPIFAPITTTTTYVYM